MLPAYTHKLFYHKFQTQRWLEKIHSSRKESRHNYAKYFQQLNARSPATNIFNGTKKHKEFAYGIIFHLVKFIYLFTC